MRYNPALDGLRAFAVLNVLISHSHNDGSWQHIFFGFDGRFAGLILGSLLPFIQWRPKSPHFGLFGIVCLWAASMIFLLHSNATLEIGLATFSIISVSIILSLDDNNSTLYKSKKPLVYFGLISYSFYLRHFPISVLLIRNFSPWQTFGMTFLASLVVSAASFELIERPLKVWRHRLRTRPALA